MKKIAALILALLLVFNLSACQSANNLSDELSEILLVETEVLSTPTQTTSQESKPSTSGGTVVTSRPQQTTSSNKPASNTSSKTSSNTNPFPNVPDYTTSEEDPTSIYKNDFFLRRGMNFDHQTSTPGEGLAQEKYFKILKDAGFDHVRITNDFDVVLHAHPHDRQKAYKNIKAVAKMATDAGLYVMLDIHKLPGIKEDPANTKDFLYTVWEEMAAYLKNCDKKVIFEILNEPADKLDADTYNVIQNECIRRIRKTNPKRWIAATAAGFTVECLYSIELPKNDKNIFITIHDYSPMAFTHQGMVGAYQNKTGVTWGGSASDYSALESRVRRMGEYALYSGRYVHLGEFGVNDNAAISDRAAWTTHMVKQCERYGIGWCYWEFNAIFGAYDTDNDKWNGILKSALIQK